MVVTQIVVKTVGGDNNNVAYFKDVSAYVRFFRSTIKNVVKFIFKLVNFLSFRFVTYLSDITWPSKCEGATASW